MSSTYDDPSATAYDPLATDECTAKPERPQPKRREGIYRYPRMIYNPLGFKRWYNFVGFFIFGLALFFFCWYNIRSANVPGHWLPKVATGSEVFWFRLSRYKIGMQLHLGCILPGGILATLQFIPIIRYKVTIFHRINGYLVTLLLLVSNAGCLMILNRSLGGFVDTQVAGGLLAITTTFSAFMGVINIRRKQIDQHRKWMMRAWTYAASIISLRFVQMAAAQVVSRIGGMYVTMPCEVLEFVGGNVILYPSCAAGQPWTAVQANIYTKVGAEEIVAGWQLTFGTSAIIAFFIHAVVLETYFHLTPGESERLRQVSFEKQLERGYKHPGSGGLTSDRLGDAPKWKPKSGIEK